MSSRPEERQHADTAASDQPPFSATSSVRIITHRKEEDDKTEKAKEVTREAGWGKMEASGESGMERMEETAEAVRERAAEVMEAVQRKMEDVKEKWRGENEQARRGEAGRDNMKSSMGISVTEAVKSKLTMPSDVVEQTRAARDEGVAGRRSGGGGGG